MILDECCLKHIPYEILDKIPTENDWDYPVPFVRIDKKDKRAWILVDNKDAKGTWIEVGGGGGSTGIEKILTSCGEIIPQTGVIEFINGDGITFECEGNKLKFGLQIPLETKFGGTGQTTYTLGDLLVGTEDGTLSKLPIGEKGKALGVKEDGTLGYIDVVEKLTCAGSEPITENALVRWNADGKCLKNNKTIEDDNGNITTRTSFDGVLTDSYRNDSLGIDKHAMREVAVGGRAGLPIFRINRVGTQVWDLSCTRDNKSFYIRGTNETKPSEVGNVVTLYKNGIFTAPNQPKATARLTQKTPNFPINEWFTIGSNLAFQKLRDEDGFNKSSNQLNVGGTADGLYYLMKYPGILDVGYQFVIDLTFNNVTALIEFRVCFGKAPDYTRLKSQFYISNEYYRTVEGSKRLILDVGDRVFFQFRVTAGNPYLNTLVSAQDNEIDNYVGFLYLGF